MSKPSCSEDARAPSPVLLPKHQIPMRTFADWYEEEPGFIKIDQVGQDDGVAAEEYCYTLTTTDIATRWSVNRSMPNRARVWVIEAIDQTAAMSFSQSAASIRTTVPSSSTTSC